MSFASHVAVASMIVAVCGSSIAFAGIIDPNGAGTNCRTFDPSTVTTVTYSGFTDGSWTGGTRRFSIRFEAANNIAIANIKYSLNRGSTWSTYDSGSLIANGTYAATVSFAIPYPVVGPGNFLVMADIPADPGNIPYGSGVSLHLSYQNSTGGGENSRYSTAVPAPGSIALLGAGGLLVVRRRRVANA